MYGPGVNFINILQAAFTRADPESAKKELQLDCLCCSFEICASKAAYRTLMKLTRSVTL